MDNYNKGTVLFHPVLFSIYVLLAGVGFGLWCLRSLSTIFQLYRGVSFIGRETGTRSVLLVEEKSLTNCILHNVVSSTPRHEQGPNSSPCLK